jgi:hypothetical protein
MYITVRTEIRENEQISTRVKYYSNYELAKSNLMMQRDIMILELVLKYSEPSTSLLDYFDILDESGQLSYTDTTLEWIDNFGEYHVKYEILKPENMNNDYIYNSNL